MNHAGDSAAGVPDASSFVGSLSKLLQADDRRIAVAESLTCGLIASTLGAGDDASAWLAGAIVAYAADVKVQLLGVDEGPVITPDCARQMAEGVAKLLHAEIALGVTGCGGPDPEEGQRPGTVFMACLVEGAWLERRFEFPGEPAAVLARTALAATELLVEAVSKTR